MTKDEATREAQRIARALRRNADAIHFGRVTWETFQVLNEGLWSEAERDPRVKSMVLALLRDDPNWKEQAS